MTTISTESLLDLESYAETLNSVYDEYGFVIVHSNNKYSQAEYIKFSLLFGKPIVNSRTDKDGVFQVGVGKTPFKDEDVNETGFAEKHTDGLTFVANPDISLLRCVTSDLGNNGYNRIYDAKQLLINLVNTSDEYFQALTKPVIEQFGGKNYRSILQIENETKSAKFFFNQDNIPDQEIYRKISQFINDLPFKRVLLKSGDILIMNNARVLHARESFTDEKRHMQRIILELEDNKPNPLNSGFGFQSC